MQCPREGSTKISAVVTLLSAALLLTASGAGAQVGTATPGESFADGLWWSVGAGAGSVRLTCDICAAERDPGLTLAASLGARARDDLDVGIEAGVWTRDDGGVRETARRLDLRAILRPWQRSGFHVIGGLGWVGYEAGDLTYDAVALSAGLGWEFPLAGRWRIGNRLLLDAASWGSFSNDSGVAADDVSLSLARLEVVLTRR